MMQIAASQKKEVFFSELMLNENFCALHALVAEAVDVASHP